ncbi:hypothetical protein V8F20_006030, partial [Naviculisporaceae sp. PSN 640]
LSDHTPPSDHSHQVQKSYLAAHSRASERDTFRTVDFFKSSPHPAIMASITSVDIPDLLSNIKGPAPTDTRELVAEIRRDLGEAGLSDHIHYAIEKPEHNVFKSDAENNNAFLKWYRTRVAVQDYLLAKVSSWSSLYQCLEACGWDAGVIDPRSTFHTIMVVSCKKNGISPYQGRALCAELVQPGVFFTGEEFATSLENFRHVEKANDPDGYEERQLLDNALVAMKFLDEFDHLRSEMGMLHDSGELTFDLLIEKIRAFGLFDAEHGDVIFHKLFL